MIDFQVLTMNIIINITMNYIKILYFSNNCFNNNNNNNNNS